MNECLIHRQRVTRRTFLIVRCCSGSRGNSSRPCSNNGNFACVLVHRCNSCVVAIIGNCAVTLSLSEHIRASFVDVIPGQFRFCKTQLLLSLLNGEVRYFIRGPSIISLCTDGYCTITCIYVIAVDNDVVRPLRQCLTANLDGNSRRDLPAIVGVGRVIFQLYNRRILIAHNRKRPCIVRHFGRLVVSALCHTDSDSVGTCVYRLLHRCFALIILHCRDSAHAVNAGLCINFCCPYIAVVD